MYEERMVKVNPFFQFDKLVLITIKPAIVAKISGSPFPDALYLGPGFTLIFFFDF